MSPGSTVCTKIHTHKLMYPAFCGMRNFQDPGVPPVRPWTFAPVEPLAGFLSCTVEERAQHLVPEKMVCRRGFVFDIATPDSTRTMCFTKAYSHYAEGTGSVILETMSREECTQRFDEHGTPARTYLSSPSSLTDAVQHTDKEKGDAASAPPRPKTSKGEAAAKRTVHTNSTCPLLALELRWMTPKELATLHGFPPSYDFPSSVSHKQVLCISHCRVLVLCRGCYT
eukprot:m.78277 g.78277  ORF g.78277 m.78277 type:complete len:226 (+) comp12531_c0_seq1:965-1642(+)